jgi:formate hydrogenlyase subunit 6/NADH:ubiquinone oxidoreductase subunit I
MNKLGTMFPDVSKSLFQPPATENYPFVRPGKVERLRGMLKWDATNCSGCGLCAMDCPANAIELHLIDRKAKKFYLTYHVDRCTFCGQCVVSCNKFSLEMSNEEWELAALNKDAFLIYFGEKPDEGQNLEGKPESQPAGTDQ